MGSPSHALVLCLVTENESEAYLDRYKHFKDKLQRLTQQITLYDIESVDRARGKKYAEKLEKTMNNCHAIVLICSPTLKAFIDDGGPSKSPLLTSKERRVIKNGMDKLRRKIILVYLEDAFSECIPRDLISKIHEIGDPVDGTKDMGTLEVRITAKLYK